MVATNLRPTNRTKGGLSEVPPFPHRTVMRLFFFLPAMTPSLIVARRPPCRDPYRPLSFPRPPTKALSPPPGFSSISPLSYDLCPSFPDSACGFFFRSTQAPSFLSPPFFQPTLPSGRHSNFFSGFRAGSPQHLEFPGPTFCIFFSKPGMLVCFPRPSFFLFYFREIEFLLLYGGRGFAFSFPPTGLSFLSHRLYFSFAP